MSSPRCASGVTTMKMMSSTSITSMRGVMLMSDLAPPASGLKASWEWTIQRRCFFSPAGGFGVGGLGFAIGSALYLLLGDEGHFLDPRGPDQVHDLHDLGVREPLVGLQVDDPAPLGQVLQPLLHLVRQLRG